MHVTAALQPVVDDVVLVVQLLDDVGDGQAGRLVGAGVRVRDDRRGGELVLLGREQLLHRLHALLDVVDAARQDAQDLAARLEVVLAKDLVHLLARQHVAVEVAPDARQLRARLRVRRQARDFFLERRVLEIPFLPVDQRALQLGCLLFQDLHVPLQIGEVVLVLRHGGCVGRAQTFCVAMGKK